MSAIPELRINPAETDVAPATTAVAPGGGEVLVRELFGWRVGSRKLLACGLFGWLEEACCGVDVVDFKFKDLNICLKNPETLPPPARSLGLLSLPEC